MIGEQVEKGYWDSFQDETTRKELLRRQRKNKSLVPESVPKKSLQLKFHFDHSPKKSPGIQLTTCRCLTAEGVGATAGLPLNPGGVRCRKSNQLVRSSDSLKLPGMNTRTKQLKSNCENKNTPQEHGRHGRLPLFLTVFIKYYSSTSLYEKSYWK